MRQIKVAGLGEVNPGEKKKITVEDKVLLLANVEGEYYAIDNRCPHMGGSLADGKMQGYQVACPRHGTVFDLRTGKVAQNGKMMMMKLHVHDVNAYPVKVEGNEIFVELE